MPISLRSGRPATGRWPGSPAGSSSHPWPVEFLFIVSPLVTWIWLGALIIISGGLIALWPVPALARRRSTAPATARVSGAPVAAREAV